MFLRVILILACAILLSSAAIGDSPSQFWQEPVPNMRLDFGYDPGTYETSFSELKPGRLAPVNNYTSVGVPGFIPTGFGYFMRARYSEFDLRFTTLADGGEKLAYLLPSFKQTSPGDWLPGIASDWDDRGIHYEVTYIAAPAKPQPVDMYRISIKNTSDSAAEGNLVAMLDGSPTLSAENDLISDRAKPLVIMDPPVPVELIARPAGCLDPRNTACGTWCSDEWRTRRMGWYGMPVEYVLKAAPGESLQVFLGFDSRPIIEELCYDVALRDKDPEFLKIAQDRGQEVVATVEGDTTPQRIKLPASQRTVLRFVGRDLDGHGYIKVSVQATPESRQPALLAMLWAFDANAKVSLDDLVAGRSDAARYKIDCGAEMIRGGVEAKYIGQDPTAFALRLHYQPKLAPGEEKVYLLRLPTIDKPEPAPYGWPGRPYDTGESWKPLHEPRHPDNSAPFGEDVPVGVDPAQYAAFGPKPQDLWEKQLSAARSLSWQDAMNSLSTFWNSFASKRTRFLVPEPFFDQLYKHQLAMLSLHRLRFGDTGYEMQLTGPDWYWDSALSRDVPYMCLAWDWSGYGQDAGSLWNTILTPRSKLPRLRWTLGQWEGSPEHDGLWITRPLQYSGQGQILWGLANHYFITGDRQWVSENYPKMRRGADWLLRAIDREKKRLGDRKAGGYGMLPPVGPEDGGPGHSYYANSFAVKGLKMAAEVAGDLGHGDDANRWLAQASDLEEAIHRDMYVNFFRYGDFAGVLPYGSWWPGPEYVKQGADGMPKTDMLPDTNYGCPLVFPAEAVPPFDPLMNAWCRNHEQQAAKSSGLFNWPYIQVDWALSYIRRGEPDRAADWLYIYADHASGCLDWGEGVNPYAVFNEFTPPKKGVEQGTMPHGWASALYIDLMRNIMMNEEGKTLHLAPAIPRKWLAQPSPVGVEKAPTTFGYVTYHLVADPDRTTIRGDVKLDPKRKPAKLLIHVRGPGGRGLSSVKINGREWDAFAGDTIIVSSPPTNIKLEAKYNR